MRGRQLLVIDPDSERAARIAQRLAAVGGVDCVASCEAAKARIADGAPCDAAIVALDPGLPADLAALAALAVARESLALIVAAPRDDDALRAAALAAGACELIAADDADSPLLPRLVIHAADRFGAPKEAAPGETAQILDADPDAVLVVATDGAVRHANPAARKLLAQAGDSIVEAWLGLPRDGGGVEVGILGSDGSRSGALRVAEILWQGEPAVLLSVRDVTERRQLEDELRAAQKLEVTGLLAGGLAHDFNNLLVVIMGNVEFLLAASPDGDPRRAMAERIDAAAERARQLNRQLLSFARRQPDRPAVFDPAEALRKLFHILRRSVPGDIELVLLPSDGIWHVELDPNALDQVLINLTFNARQAMPRGGRIEIDLANVSLDDGRDGLTPGDYVRIGVSDTGEGIAAQDIGRIFEAFFTTRPDGTGTGLGLAVSRRIVRQAGGDILVDSEPGEGATFAVYLPRSLAVAKAGAGEETAREPDVEGSERILVVEDDAVVGEALRTALVRKGFRPVLAANGEEAIRLVERQGPFDLVLCDVVMPLMTGREFADWLATQYPAARLLMMTGHSDAVHPPQHPDRPGRLIHKPFTPRQLMRAVRDVLDDPA